MFGAVGLAVGAAVMFVGAGDELAVLRTPAFATWLVLYIGQIGLWFVLAPFAWNGALQARNDLHKIGWPILAGGLLAILIAVFLPSVVSSLLPGLPITKGRGDTFLQNFLQMFRLRLGVTVLIAVLAIVAPSVSEIWVVHATAVQLCRALAVQNDAEHAVLGTMISTYLVARDHLQSALVRLGTAVSALTIVTAQLRNAEVAYIDPTAAGSSADAIFPNVYVLLYGLYFTCLVAMVYLPVAQVLGRAARNLRDRIADVHSVEATNFGSWFQTRKNASDLLQTDADNLGQLKTVVTILAPFLGSIVGVNAAK